VFVPKRGDVPLRTICGLTVLGYDSIVDDDSVKGVSPPILHAYRAVIRDVGLDNVDRFRVVCAGLDRLCDYDRPLKCNFSVVDARCGNRFRWARRGAPATTLASSGVVAFGARLFDGGFSLGIAITSSATTTMAPRITLTRAGFVLCGRCLDTAVRASFSLRADVLAALATLYDGHNPRSPKPEASCKTTRRSAMAEMEFSLLGV
jgi:hypothetical protein